MDGLLSGIRTVSEKELPTASISSKQKRKNQKRSKDHRKTEKSRTRSDSTKKRTGNSRSKKKKQSNGSESEGEDSDALLTLKRRKKKWKGDTSDSESLDDSDSELDAKNPLRGSADDAKQVRQMAGLDWMNQAPVSNLTEAKEAVETPPKGDEIKISERELNPYWRLGEASGFPPEDPHGAEGRRRQTVGDGGASWRMKALKRAKEQAERDGKSVEEVVGERWGSVADLTRRQSVGRSDQSAEIRARFREDERRKHGSHGRRTDMKAPKETDILSWRKKEVRGRENEHGALRSEADVSRRSPEPRRQEERRQKAEDVESQVQGPVEVKDDGSRQQVKVGDLPGGQAGAGGSDRAAGLTANQVAAKAMRLRLMGKHAEADELLRSVESSKQEVEVVVLPQVDAQGRLFSGAVGNNLEDGHLKGESSGQRVKPLQRFDVSHGQGKGPGERVRYFADDDSKDLKSLVASQRHGAVEENYETNLAQNIIRNRKFKGLTAVDDEYDHDMGLEMGEARSKQASRKLGQGASAAPRADLSRMERHQKYCQLCFDAPNKPKHLMLAIATRTYLMLPPGGRLTAGHCYICTMQHEGSSRNVDEAVWEEIRNFKKCLVKMYAAQGWEAVFMETAMGLSRQKQHCYIEAVPILPDQAMDAPLYFKKGLQEAEEEWSQHSGKAVIDTRVKGLRTSIPPHFPYFNVEFGMQGGYCHVIDDENHFRASFGRDIMAGIMELSPEESHGRKKADSAQVQLEAVKTFLKMWEPHDWTKLLD